MNRAALAAALAHRLARPQAPASAPLLAAPPTVRRVGSVVRTERLSDTVTLHLGDSRDVVLAGVIPPVQAIVTDPPYALVSIVKRFGKPGSAAAQVGATGAYARASAGFMGQTWDTGETAFDPEFWADVMALLVPGGHIVAASGTRTYHRLACAIEDSGFEIRDMVSWLYGSGFPKSHDVSKAMDSRKDWALTERLSVEIKRSRAVSGLSLRDIGETMLAATNGQYGTWYHRGGHMFFETGRSLPSRPEWSALITLLPIAPDFLVVYDQAEREVTGSKTYGRGEDGSWATHAQGSGTMFASGEREVLTTAPATDAAREWSGWGTALKPACEPWVLGRKPLIGTVARNVAAHRTGALNIDACRIGAGAVVPGGGKSKRGAQGGGIYGDGESAENAQSHTNGRWPANVAHDGSDAMLAGLGDPARFFYCAKASKADREEGMGDAETTQAGFRNGSGRHLTRGPGWAPEARANNHPTVKPVELMRWLCRLVTPPGGVVLDPFMGSGSTGKAAVREGFGFVGIERDPAYFEICLRRIEHAIRQADRA